MLPVKVLSELYVDAVGAISEPVERLAKVAAHALEVLSIQMEALDDINYMR